MKHISSRENALYKEIKNLAVNANARKKSGKTLLDGVHLCQAYLQHRGVPDLCVVSEVCVANDEVVGIVNRCEQIAVQIIVVPDALYRVLSQVENGVGILFVISIAKLAAPVHLTVNAVLLDNLQDPGNLGSILRSAAGAGIQQVFCSSGSASAWSPKVLRAGMGAHFALEIYEGVDLYSLLAQSNFPVLATSSHTKTSIYEVNLNRQLAWLFGHEGQGVDPRLMELATQIVTIPQKIEIESLNVAASAAICFFEQSRQHLVGLGHLGTVA
ncbi:TrmH family RNA methyltransferase [Undibacterium fentianense]|uniref:RNA methyltransferase n=1 Tax=Undibacterium fentianense TaxID=2828728 RepID=A0A941DZG4_9BURK|nr:RNA methyltransferase [Undibacterium fentianense]MBR7798472.1 RNA methyltransferase [Undibacterium fentianense]